MCWWKQPFFFSCLLSWVAHHKRQRGRPPPCPVLSCDTHPQARAPGRPPSYSPTPTASGMWHPSQNEQVECMTGPAREQGTQCLSDTFSAGSPGPAAFPQCSRESELQMPSGDSESISDWGQEDTERLLLVLSKGYTAGALCSPSLLFKAWIN